MSKTLMIKNAEHAAESVRESIKALNGITDPAGLGVKFYIKQALWHSNQANGYINNAIAFNRKERTK